MPTLNTIVSTLRFGVAAWSASSVVIAFASIAAFAFAPLDLLNQIAPFWLLCALTGVLFTFTLQPSRERTAARAGFALAALAHTALIAPEFTRQTPAPISPPADAPRVRIVWLNAQSGSAAEGVANYLLNSGADFILLGEYHPEGNEIPADIASQYPHFAACLEPHDCNVVILSRRAPRASRPTYAESESGLRNVWAEFDVDGAPLRLIGAHLHRPYPTDRHAAERQELGSLIATAAPANTILAGDFNATPWSFALRSFDRDIPLTRHDRATPTWPATPWTRVRLPAPEAFMPIDHIYSGANWRLVSIRRGPRTGADHFPLEAEFVWNGAP